MHVLCYNIFSVSPLKFQAHRLLCGKKYYFLDRQKHMIYNSRHVLSKNIRQNILKFLHIIFVLWSYYDSSSSYL